MRQPEWFRLSSVPMHAPWQHKASFFIALSVAGTLLALIILIFDGWVDALAIYVICSLMLALLLSRLASQQDQSYLDPTVEGTTSEPGNRHYGFIIKRSSWFQSNGSRSFERPVPEPLLARGDNNSTRIPVSSKDCRYQDVVRPLGVDQPVLPAVLSKLTPTD